MSKPEYNDFELKMIDTIAEHGWQCMRVFDPDGNDENFAYSVGFTATLSAPECICFGLSLDLMHNMLWELFKQVKDGSEIAHGKRWSNVLEGYDCITLKATHPDLMTEYAVSAGWYGRNVSGLGEPEVYQLIWPGVRDRLFPWQPGCTQDVIDAQPQLWSDVPPTG